MALRAVLLLAFPSAAPAVLLGYELAARGVADLTDAWKLWPDGQIPTGLGGVARVGDEAFVHADPEAPVARRCAPGIHYGDWYFNVTEPTITPHVVDPGHPNRTNASVLIFPGGGYQLLAWTSEGDDIAEWLNSIGISAFVVKYRVPETAPQVPSVQDAQRALSLVRSRADSLGLSPTRVGVIGFSAGGSVVARVSHARNRAYTPIDEVDTFHFRPNFQLVIYGTGVPIMVITGVHPPPPTFLIGATDDPCIQPQWMLSYYQALLDAGLRRAELAIYPEGRHGYGICKGYPDKWFPVCEWPKKAAIFIQRQVLAV